jgi:hypothetical protein
MRIFKATQLVDLVCARSRASESLVTSPLIKEMTSKPSNFTHSLRAEFCSRMPTALAVIAAEFAGAAGNTGPARLGNVSRNVIRQCCLV